MTDEAAAKCDGVEIANREGFGDRRTQAKREKNGGNGTRASNLNEIYLLSSDFRAFCNSRLTKRRHMLRFGLNGVGTWVKPREPI